MPTSTTKDDFETQLERLEEIVEELEAGGLPLDATFAKYEEGVKLVRSCRERLAVVERRVEELLADGTARRLDVA